MKSLLYLDHAATTKTAPDVLAKMLPYFSENYGNPSSVYAFAQTAKSAVAKSRGQIADCIGAKMREIYYTSGASESDNWALCKIMESYCEKGNHLITTQIEHPAILNTCHYLEQNGCEVTYLPVDKNGRISLYDLENAIKEKTVLISIMSANNEVGTIEPIQQIGAIAKKHHVLFHTDAVQAMGHMKIDVEKCQIDLLSASGHKFYGPKGIGFLYCREGVLMHALIHGGEQERGRRAGTENVPGIVGLGYAAERMARAEDSWQRQLCLRDRMIGALAASIPDAHLNGSREGRLCNNVNMRFDGVLAESLLIRLDMEGICASAGSACASGSLSASHVLLAMGLSEEQANSSLRFTLGEETTSEEIERAVLVISKNVKELRMRRA